MKVFEFPTLIFLIFTATVNARVLLKQPQIIGGNPAPKGKWPWQLSLQYRLFTEFRHTCGASLINQTHALTAAHCVQGRIPLFKFRVLLGASNRGINDEEQIMEVESAHIHPGYVAMSTSIPNDIAVLKLVGKAKYNQYVKFANLPIQADGPSFAGAFCYATGWGKTEANATTVPLQLQEAKVEVLTTDDCNSKMPKEHQVRNEHICIWDNEGKRSSCQGDSGGPLNCKTSEGASDFTVVGVTSWGIGASDLGKKGPNCLLQYPSAYARTSVHRQFIDTGVPAKSN